MKIRRLLTIALVSIAVLSLLTARAGMSSGSERDLQPHSGRSWILDGPIYNINPPIRQGDPKYDEYHATYTFGNFIRRIPDLKRLGVMTVYLSPVWEHVPKLDYSIIDYYKIDPSYGTEAQLRELIDVVHSNGMKIIFDLVAGYFPSQSVIYQSHPDRLLRDKEGKPANPRWEPTLDRSNPGAIEYLAKVARYYVEKYNIDGWRVDAPQNLYSSETVSGDHSATAMLRRIKKEITDAKLDAVLLTEWMGPLCEGNPKAEPLFDEMAEASYGWFFTGVIRPILPTMEGKSREEYSRYIMETIAKDPEKLYREAKFIYRNGFLDKMVSGEAGSQDLVGFLNNEYILYGRTRARYIEIHEPFRVSGAFPRQHRPLLVLISTIPGVPMIYAGQEIGELRPAVVNWQKGDFELMNFYRKVFEIRRKSDALKYGTIANVWSGGDNTYAYLRTYKDNHVIVAINLQNKPVSSDLRLPVDTMRLDPGKQYTLVDALNEETFAVKGSELNRYKVALPAYGARILLLQ